jgi:hypothetical protein
MSRWAQGVYEVTNKHKYVGKGTPRYRSGWEHAFFRFCDNNDSVLQWASESISIPYLNPVTGKQSIYIPDVLITYQQKNGAMRAELIEIKPKGQSVIKEGMKPKERAVVAINYAKWAAAQKWCARNGLSFRVITEDDMFVNGGR